MAAVTYATKECLYCGRINNADINQCEGCGASSFGPIQVVYAGTPYVGVPYQPPSLPVQPIQPGVRVFYFVFIGWSLGFYWAIFSALVTLTIIGYPLGRAFFSLLPVVATLQKQPQTFGERLRQGWQETITTFRDTSLIGKIIGIAVSASIFASIVWFFSS